MFNFEYIISEYRKYKILIYVGLCLFGLIMLFVFSGRLLDTFDAWRNYSNNKQLQQAKEENIKAKQIASEAIKELHEANNELNKQKEITKEAEDKLYKSKEISDSEVRDYETQKKRIKETTYRSNTNSNASDICKRAESLGISCD